MNWVPGGAWGWGRRAQSPASSCPAHTLSSTAKVGAASHMGCAGGEQWGPGQPHTDGALASQQSCTRQSVVFGVFFFFFFNLNVFIFNWRTVAVLVSATHQHDSAVGTHVPSPSRSQAVRARDSSSLCHRANSCWLSNFTYGNVHIQRFSLGGPHRLLPRCAHKSVLQRTGHTAERTPNWG